ncbi:MAG: glycoside hydrolase family 3 N-terminal domain-containing protein, partial [Clostridia bacterium]|nr:glycoside hydrolase family 3 N-terminal domain-containing protein [Clostridia bacterium]
VPFDEAIKNGADVVMVAHILIADIDADNPSSLSKAVITDLLRHHMNFDGVVISDDLTMGAITENMDLGQAAIKAVNAGSDIILVCHGYHDQVAIIKALKTAVEQGDISRQRIDQSVYRIISLKQKYKLNDNFIQSIDVEKINNETNKILNEYIK